LLGISVSAVRHRRIALKIHRREPSRRLKWTPDKDAMLGKMPDVGVARIMKCSEGAVTLRRNKLKIPAFVPNWTQEEDALLKQFCDAEVARRLGRSLSGVKKRRSKLGLPQTDPPFVWWKPEEDKLLGTAPDAVKGRRLLLRIKFPNPRRPWPPEEMALLGTQPDAVLAKKFNRPEQAVRSKRLQMGRPETTKNAEG
jgi:hypothetical protein